ncbi:hypothetical protein JR316_0013043 [Psilocybe cubensis]|uniref:Uncharacterized protein n=2 Tax=Psilocybe cubensis TaxID=181762 RepID=A0A8H8CI60_PSICU|nr:hypothetical protein JR316_0013043 [Psilocybe cubensis]KAH9474581.1 hypothetical protein JR316_0013043 [Psilocybe cubensis]
MSAITANRRALSVACRHSRQIHSSITTHAAVVSPSALAEQEFEEISLQPIFDIFDAPTRLSESSEFIRDKYKTVTKAKATPQTPTTEWSAGSSRSSPTPLPSPIVFDGPARPKNEALAFQRRMRDAGLAPQPHPRRAQASSARTFSSSEPLVQMFEGPARITRYHHHSQSDSQQNRSKLVVALGVAGAVGCATLYNENDDSRLGLRK